MERGWKSNIDISPACPRCGSSNTKFCYYNNYSLTQPRYFCKGCRRYWTKGGSLRNVPVGGGCRKSRRARDRSARVPLDGVLTRSPAFRAGQPQAGSSNPSAGGYGPSSSSSTDLQEVYANFLNQPREQPDTRVEVKDLPVEIDWPFETSNVSGWNMAFGTRRLPQVNGLAHARTHLNNANAVYFSRLDPVPKHQETIQQFITGYCMSNNYGLPPLPGEELAAPYDILWSNPHMMAPEHILHSTEESQEQSHLIDNGNPFDMSSFEIFFGP